MSAPTPTPRTDAAWSSSFDGKQLSAGQTARALRECSQKLESELAALRSENATLRAAQKACEACDEPTAFEVRQLRAELAAERARLDWLESDAGVDWQWSSSALTIRRAVIDAAMKEDAQ